METMETAPSVAPTMLERSTLVRFFRWLCTWRVIRRLLIGLAWLATILALFYAVENWRGRRAWNRYRGQFEAQGGQLNWQAFIPKPVPDEQNFAATPFFASWASQGAKVWVRDQRWNSDAYSKLINRVGPKNSRIEKGERSLLDLPGWELAFAAERAGKLDRGERFESGRSDPESRAKAAPAVLDWLSRHDAVFAELEAASHRPGCRYPVVYDMENPWGILIPHLSIIKAICHRLQLKACAELAAGRVDAALTDVKLMFRLIDSLEPEPFLISYLVRVACVQLAAQPIWEGLAERRWADAQLQELERLLQQMDYLADVQQPLQAERAAGVLSAELIRKKGLGFLVTIGDGEAGLLSDQSVMNALGMLVPSGWYYLEQLNYCRLFEQQTRGMFDAAARRVSPRQIEANAHEFEKQMDRGRNTGFKAFRNHQAIAALLLPALHKLPLRAAVAQTTVDQAALGCALERHRLATGQFPETLAALTPRFISALPSDLLAGRPYLYRRTDDGRFVLYSVGWNETDDGGVPGKMVFDETHGDWVWEYPRK